MIIQTENFSHRLSHWSQVESYNFTKIYAGSMSKTKVQIVQTMSIPSKVVQIGSLICTTAVRIIYWGGGGWGGGGEVGGASGIMEVSSRAVLLHVSLVPLVGDIKVNVKDFY